MVKELRAAKLLRLRELFLEVLKAEKKQACQHSPGPVDLVVLRNVLASLGIEATRAEVLEQGQYLEEKGYCVIEGHELGDVQVKLVEITAKGCDLLDGLIKDATVIAG